MCACEAVNHTGSMIFTHPARSHSFCVRRLIRHTSWSTARIGRTRVRKASSTTATTLAHRPLHHLTQRPAEESIKQG